MSSELELQIVYRLMGYPHANIFRFQSDAVRQSALEILHRFDERWPFSTCFLELSSLRNGINTEVSGYILVLVIRSSGQPNTIYYIGSLLYILCYIDILGRLRVMGMFGADLIKCQI